MSESDWQDLNAYADGELSEAASRALARRLVCDPVLARALADVHAAKVAASLLRPERDTADPPRERRRRHFRNVAIAASLVAAVIVAAAFNFTSHEDDWLMAPRELHATFSTQAYALPEAGPVPVISTGRIGDLQFVDLSASRLVPVDVQSLRRNERDIVAMHYRGRNGCRVTLVALAAMAGDTLMLPKRDGLSAVWTTGTIHYVLLADGMDLARFGAIEAYAQAETQRLAPRDELRVAMRTATDEARPCA